MTRDRYSDGNDTVILECPWDDHSGNIPPPAIRFFRDGSEREFVYQGAES